MPKYFINDKGFIMDEIILMLRILWNWIKDNRLISIAILSSGSVFLAITSSFLFEWIRDSVLPWMSLSSTKNYIVIIVICTITAIIGILFGLVVAINSFKRYFKGQKVHNLNNIHTLKLTLFWELMCEINKLIQSSIHNTSKEALEDIIDNYFYLIFENLGIDSIRGGAIFLVKPSDENFLYYWFGSKTKQGKSEKEFYIGEYTKDQKEKTPRGTTGKVFRNDKPIIINILDQKEGIADDPSYYKFDKKPTSRYDSFVAIPIHWADSVIGVLSIESYEKYTFQNDDLPLLQSVTDRMGNILYHHQIIR